MRIFIGSMTNPNVTIECLNNCNLLLKEIQKENEFVNQEDSSDILLFLPGMDNDLVRAVTRKREGEHDKEIVIFNDGGYYDKVIVNDIDKSNYFMTNSNNLILYYVNNYKKVNYKKIKLV